jgi:ubiquinone/menaquinone biosynthesis C-methylase UbiE
MNSQDIKAEKFATNFDEAAYLEANLDVATAVKSGIVKSGYAHWIEHGKAEKRPLNIFNTRKYKIFHSLNKNGCGLEIGPSHNPIAPKREGYDVQIIDHTTAEILRAKYKSHGLNLENIEDVDFVWKGEPLSELVGRTECYDWIIASHVIEHIPDIISFLVECSKVLKPAGVVSLVVPDKRYCFDYFQPLTTTGSLLDAYYEKMKRPSAGKIFDELANACAKNNSITWTKSTIGDFSLLHAIEQAQETSRLAQRTDQYIDVHCWRFTPSSFELIIQDLQQLNLVDLGYKVSFDTSGCEFYVSLERTKIGSKPKFKSRLDLHKAIRKEELS